jgi:L-rhamnose isomerase
MDKRLIDINFDSAKEIFAEYGINVESVLNKFDSIPISIPCWQGDDVGGFERGTGGATGGIMATGNYPGKPRTAEELRDDMDKAMQHIPGPVKINLHTSYGEDYEADIDRDEYGPRHFTKWVVWAKDRGIALDMNATTFGHPKATSNLTISNPDKDIREFWIKHMKAARRITEFFGKTFNQPSVFNTWVQDGIKDMSPNKMFYRGLMKDSFDQIFSENISKDVLYDALEPKLFGIGLESFTVGSNDFYMLYHGHAKANGIGNTILNMDMGHFHPTETIADKISSVMQFSDKMTAHFTRGIRWDSDHVVINDEQTNEAMREIVRAGILDDVFFGTDYFDATINRVAAWIIGTRATKKALLGAMLEPVALLKKAENENDTTKRLMLMDEFRSLPVNAVWSKYCERNGIIADTEWFKDIKMYEQTVMFKR